MKILAIILVFSISFCYNSAAQTADEILTKTEDVYSNMKNYVDEGEVIEFRYADWRNVFSKDHTETKKYVTAHDDAKNVYHFIKRDKQEAYGGDYSYAKSHEDGKGVFTRIYPSKTELENYPIYEASARLVATGGGVLIHSVSLHYPEMFEYESKGVLRRYTTADRLKDTMIQGEVCFVIDLYTERVITQEYIDEVRHIQDSTNKVEGTFYSSADEMKPSMLRFDEIFFIRQKDNLIVRRHQFKFQENNEKKLSRAILMNPRINIDNFEKYLVEKN